MRRQLLQVIPSIKGRHGSARTVGGPTLIVPWSRICGPFGSEWLSTGGLAQRIASVKSWWRPFRYVESSSKPFPAVITARHGSKHWNLGGMSWHCLAKHT